MRSVVLFRAAIVFGGLLMAGAVVRAADPADSAAPGEPVSGHQSGLVAIVDGATGELSEDSSDLDLLLGELATDEAFSTSSMGLSVVELPDGSLMSDLEGRFQIAVVATIGADGEVSVGHAPIQQSMVSAAPTDAPACRSEAGGAR